MAVRTPSRSGTLDSAVRAALKLLAARSRSRHELRLALRRRGFTTGEQNAALSRLDSLGYLDDARFARQRAVTLLSSGFGPRAVLSRLLAHGLTDAEAKRGLRESETEIGFNELESAQALLRKRRLDAKEDRKSLARAARLLGARGFSEEVISRLIDRPALDSERQDD
jgi:regulatory protein